MCHCVPGGELDWRGKRLIRQLEKLDFIARERGEIQGGAAADVFWRLLFKEEIPSGETAWCKVAVAIQSINVLKGSTSVTREGKNGTENREYCQRIVPSRCLSLSLTKFNAADKGKRRGSRGTLFARSPVIRRIRDPWIRVLYQDTMLFFFFIFLVELWNDSRERLRSDFLEVSLLIEPWKLEILGC